jgi:uncharacterized membrane protein
MDSHNSTSSRRRGVAAIAALAMLVMAASPASADPPPAATGTTSHGFLAKRDVLSTIDHPEATTVPATASGQAGTATTGINDRGKILGAFEGRDRVVRHFVRDRSGRFTLIDDPPGGSAFDEYVDINNRGEIVGFYNDDQGFTTTGFLRTKKGGLVAINVPGSQVTGPLKVNDRRQVVGVYVDGDGGVHGFLWDDGDTESIDAEGAAATVVTGVNDRGQLVGSYIDADGDYHGFLRDKSGAITTLPEAPGAEPAMGGTMPTAINERGQVVGLAYDAQGGSRGFLFERGGFTPIDGPDAVYTRAVDINERGQIVGDYGTRPPADASSSGTEAAAPSTGSDLPGPFGLGVSGVPAWLP